MPPFWGAFFMSLSQKFFLYFSGCTTAHGQTTVLDSSRNGKMKAKSFIVREPLTLKLVEQHLKGERGIGSIPIDETNNCVFGALDIDDYNLDLIQLKKKIKRLKLPLIICRSKSGGAHCFLFVKEKISAAEMRDKLAEFASALGFGGCEIFPKQEEVKTERGDVGNFINLPYFNEQYSTRYAIKNNGDAYSLEEFIDLIESNSLSLKQLHNFKIHDEENVLPSGPPCLQQLTEFGIPEGGRNQTLMNIGIYYKLSSPSDWKEKLEEHNQKYCNPSLPAKEIVTIQEQLEKKDYAYMCKQEPLCSHCNRGLCRSRKFGIASHQAFPILGGLTVVESEPPVWFVDVDGARLELSTRQLQMQVEFQRAAMEQMYKMPIRMKETEWRDLIDNLLESATRISVPEELTQKGQFQELLEMFCTSRIKAHSPEELLTGKPWTDDGITYFKLSSLQEFLKRNGFTYYTRGQITERLKEMNGGSESDKEYRFKDSKDNWKKVRVWFIPEPERGEVELPDVNFTDEAPF